MDIYNDDFIPFLQAIEDGDLSRVKYFLESHRVRVKDCDIGLRQAVSFNQFNIVDYFTGLGVKNNESMFVALRLRYLNIAELLLKKHCVDVHTQDEILLWSAVIDNYMEAVILLVRYDADWKRIPSLSNFSSKREVLKYLELLRI